MRVFKRILSILGIILGVLLLAAVGLAILLTVNEYKPAAVETIKPKGSSPTLDKTTFTVLAWNIGYCGLSAESDYFMDGGKGVRAASEQTVRDNLAAVQNLLAEQDADFVLLQEVDYDSHRSYGLDEAAALGESADRTSAFALNYSCSFVPYPWPPIGEVHSGLLTTSKYAFSRAERVSLNSPFKWPISVANLKRCLLVTRIPLTDSRKELVLVNIHMEAYDDGGGKLDQSRQLRALLVREFNKGNYVVAGGDWNQLFPETEKTWPDTHQHLWAPGYLDASKLEADWRYTFDGSVPTCRLLNQPYDPADTENTQYYVIDGYLVSPNLKVLQVETLDLDFANSDHNPVTLKLRLKE